MYNQNQNFVITTFCSNKIKKDLINRYWFSSLFPVWYFLPIYMVFGEIIIIRTSFHFCLLWSKRRSQIIMKLHEREVRGIYVLQYDFVIEKFYMTYFVMRHPNLKKSLLSFFLNSKFGGVLTGFQLLTRINREEIFCPDILLHIAS